MYIGKRADYFLSEILTDFSRTQIKKFIENKCILINEHSFKPSRLIIGNEVIDINIPPPEKSELIPQRMDLEIIYEDKDLIAINKPAGLVVHPGAGIKQGTLVNALLYMCKDLSGIGGELRPGIVHRLDKETSGVIVAAKNDYSHRNLVDQFKNREVHKKYIAIVIGEINKHKGTFKSFIGRHKTNRIKMSSSSSNGREAVTNWEVLKKFKNYTLISAEPKTGRTHQIRVHFSANGFPILGDKLYCRKNINLPYNKHLRNIIKRHALHALELEIKHPRTNKLIRFKAEMPKDIKEVIKLLEKDNNESNKI
ncbi:MAG: RluA family pseudouridine synthase [Candidatus Dadabacteria bacterium]|nr:RluA family pseudouridine synthase [Candidatus Dadabacteria bacterium]NIQ16219.1 RluA family pseudouridine synthase [Candidatus Dadabacteria bacterium]